MKFEKIKFSTLIPSDYNPRLMSKDEEKRLENNLEKFGLVDPIIVNLKNNHIVGGHQRYNALYKKYGGDVDFTDPDLNIIKLGDIGWVFEDDKLKIKDENHEKALNLALNKISGEWDYGKLSDVLDDLTKVHFDMDLTGFDSSEVETFIIPEDISISFEEITKITSEENNEPIKNEIKEKYFEEREESNIETISDVDNVSIDENYSYSDDENEDEEVFVSEDEINSIKKFKCPKCGHEW